MKGILKKCITALLVTTMIASSFTMSAYATEEVHDVHDVEVVEEEVMPTAAADGTMMSNAVEVTLGQTYYKTWTPSTDHLNHYVKFTLSKRGIVTVKATKPFDDEGEYGRIYFTIYDKDGNPVMGNDSYEAVDNAKSRYEFCSGLAAGTYYMTMLPGFRVSSGTIDTAYSVSFGATEYCEVEPNGGANKATFMNYDKMYTGYFGSASSDYEEEDYYKFPILKGHTYRIVMEGYGEMQETSTILYLLTNEEESLGYHMRYNVDVNGLNFYEFKADSSRMAYINFYNYMRSQYKFRIKVMDLTTSSGKHKATGTVTNPTCVKDGYTTYKCSCGGSYVSNYVSATGNHNYAKTVTNPTCTAAGYTVYKCKDCSYSYKGDHKNAKGHNYSKTVTEVTCQSDGYTDYKCKTCGYSYRGDYEYANGIHGYDGVTCRWCGYTYTGDISVYRIAGKNRCETAFKIANETKKQLGVEEFETIIVASGKNFADALTGSYLAKVKSAPIIMSNGTNDSDIKSYVRRNLSSEGTVYILGGTSAVPATLEDALSAYHVVRLAGDTRLKTNIEILREAGVTDEEIIVATSTNFADSLSASAAGKPILLVNNKLGGLTEEQRDYLDTLKSDTFYIVGGTSAVSSDIAGEFIIYGSVERLGGATRFETSVMIAEEFFDEPTTIVLAYSKNFPDGLAGGPLAMSLNAPLILTATGKEDVAADYAYGMAENGYVLGGTGLISNAATQNVFDLWYNTPIPLL